MTEYGPDLEAAIRRLRKRRFCRRPFRVYVAPARHIKKLVGAWGNASCYVQGRPGRIYIAQRLAFSAVIDSLLHEYAHHWDLKPDETVTEFHRKSWGERYAKVFEFYHKEP